MHPQFTTKDLDRFWPKITFTTCDCWIWNAAKVDGYGIFKANGRNWQAHRYLFEYLFGYIPDGFQIDHLCRNRACVNPEHLEIVDCRTNLLRGKTLAAKNAQKTHCPQGHEYTPNNIYWFGRDRHCKICTDASATKRYWSNHKRKYKPRTPKYS